MSVRALYLKGEERELRERGEGLSQALRIFRLAPMLRFDVWSEARARS